MSALNLTNDQFLNKFALRLCEKLGVDAEKGTAMVTETVAEFQAIIAEEEERNTCKALIKSGDLKGQACGKKFKEGCCPVHKPHNSNITPKEEEDFQKCDMVLKTGERKGQTCDKKCADGQERCAIHMRVQTPGNGCAYVFARGDRAGQTCDKKREGDEEAYCAFHKSAVEKSASKEKSEPKEKSAPKEKKSEPKDSDKAAEAAPFPKAVDPEQIRAVKRGAYLAIKGTTFAISEDAVKILGWTNKVDDVWVLMAEYQTGMEEAAKKYGLTCEFKPALMVVEEDDE